MTRGRLARGFAVALATPFLGACTAGLFAVQAVPAAIGGTAVANADQRSPFVTYAPGALASGDRDLQVLDAHLRRAECGDAESQYWLGSALRSDYNTAPDAVEVYKWYRLAQMQRHAPASDALAELAATMTDQEVARARARADAWRPRSEDCLDDG